jgi:predicted DNA-binding protein (UPF0251 family)
VGRPPVEIDVAEVERLAGLGLTQEEIALSLGISERTLRTRKKDSAVFADAMKKGRTNAAKEVANALYQKAVGGDLGAIIWYEKTRRGLSDKVETQQSGEIKLKVVYGDDGTHNPAS